MEMAALLVCVCASFHPHVCLIAPAVRVETEVWQSARWVIRRSPCALKDAALLQTRLFVCPSRLTCSRGRRRVVLQMMRAAAERNQCSCNNQSADNPISVSSDVLFFCLWTEHLQVFEHLFSFRLRGHFYSFKIYKYNFYLTVVLVPDVPWTHGLGAFTGRCLCSFPVICV